MLSGSDATFLFNKWIITFSAIFNCSATPPTLFSPTFLYTSFRLRHRRGLRFVALQASGSAFFAHLCVQHPGPSPTAQHRYLPQTHAPCA